MNTLIARTSTQIKCFYLVRHWSKVSLTMCQQNDYHVKTNTICCNRASYCLPEMSSYFSINKNFMTQPTRYSSKKKKSSKFKEEIEESDDEGADESPESDEMGDDYNLVTKNVGSLRLDSVLKSGFGISKKKIEKDFYAGKIRINGEKVLKKAATIQIEDELDLVQGNSPDNYKMLIVDRLVVKSIGRVNDAGFFPIKMQVLKSLTIENYNDPWVKSSLSDDD